MSDPTGDTLALVTAQLAAGADPEITKAFTQPGSATTGLQGYDLQIPALTLYPVLTPLRNTIPRVSANGGLQANWKAITGINTANTGVGLGEGQRGGIITTSTADYLAAYRGIGLDDNVTYEADFAAEGFQDLKATAQLGLLRSLMIGEESVLLGGNTSKLLGTTPTPTLAAATTGGTLATQTLSVICVALGYDAYWSVAGLNNGATGQVLNVASAVVPASITRTNAGGTTSTYGGGSAQKSAAATVAVTGATGSATASVTAVTGAAGYAWYWGAAGSEVLGAITNINSVAIAATATGTQTAASMPASDNSTSSLVFDGLLSQIAKSGSGSYVAALPTGTAGTGTKLTTDGAGGVTEFNAAFQQFWNLYRLSPDVVYCNAQEMQAINKLIIANGGAPLIRYGLDKNGGNSLDAGLVIGSLTNNITGQKVTLMVHPTMPPGTVMFRCSALPYSLSGVSNVVQVRTRRDYYSIDWPQTQRRYDYGVYADEVLQNYFPPAFGVITNIAK
jgi:hypothetical protein